MVGRLSNVLADQRARGGTKMVRRKLETSRQEVLREFLQNLCENFMQYHGRKENLAWVATTVYLGGILGIASQLIDNGKLIHLETPLKWGLIGVIVITCVVTFAFMIKQFSDRTLAAHIISSCNEALGAMLDPEFELTDQLLRACNYEENGHSFLFPKILITQLNSSNRQPHRILWNYLAPYLAVFTWTVALIVLVLIS
jgi:hypothetical protein